MNVQELIDELEKVGDKSLAVCISDGEIPEDSQQVFSTFHRVGSYFESTDKFGNRHLIQGKYICIE